MRRWLQFPISRDPPEGGTSRGVWGSCSSSSSRFPISRDPPEGGTSIPRVLVPTAAAGFQFLGIPPKGEHEKQASLVQTENEKFPISRDPPEGGTMNKANEG